MEEAAHALGIKRFRRGEKIFFAALKLCIAILLFAMAGMGLYQYFTGQTSRTY